jgi:hypothetical protein
VSQGQLNCVVECTVCSFSIICASGDLWYYSISAWKQMNTWRMLPIHQFLGTYTLDLYGIAEQKKWDPFLGIIPWTVVMQCEILYCLLLLEHGGHIFETLSELKFISAFSSVFYCLGLAVGHFTPVSPIISKNKILKIRKEMPWTTLFCNAVCVRSCGSHPREPPTGYSTGTSHKAKAHRLKPSGFLLLWTHAIVLDTQDQYFHECREKNHPEHEVTLWIILQHKTLWTT